MAKPSTSIQRTELNQTEATEQALQQLTQEVAKHSVALQSLLELAQELESSGVLAMGTSLLKAKDEVLKVVLEQVSKPGSTNAIQNTLRVVETFSRIDAQQVHILLNALVGGLESGREQFEKKPVLGFFDLVRALRDPDVNRALTLGLGVLKGMGESLGKS